MNDIRRQLLQESFKLVDLVIMVVAFGAAFWVFTHQGQSGPPSFPALPALDLVDSPVEPPLTPKLSPQAASFLPSFEWPGFLKPQNFLTFMSILFVWHMTLSSRRLYQPDRLDMPLVDTLEVFRGGLLGGLVIVLIAAGSFPQLQTDPARFFVTFFILSTGSTIVVRLAIRYLLERLRLRGRNLRSVLVVGTNARAQRFAETLRQRPELGYYVDGFVDEDWDGMESFLSGGSRLVAGLKNLGDYLATHVVDEVVVALPVSSAYLHSKRIVSLCLQQGITVRFISQIFDPRLAKGKLDLFETEPMISLIAEPNAGFSKVIKKIVDVAGAALVLTFAAPLLLLVAAAIRCSSAGPVLFVQKRVGLNKRMFSLYKFRTMVPDAEAQLAELEHLNQVSGPVFKIENDPRVTKIGRFLRKTSLDELPQLWNVLIGDMSLVGPRPLPLRDYEGFDDDSHRRRLSVKPGITCLWQVRGRNSIPFDQWMRLDLEYIDNWSLWLDLKILCETLPVVLGPLFWGQKGEFVKGLPQEVAASKSGSST
jgi:exopolysaccharide biosynthesis polyprenyl glycosylphosphotransferase